MNNFKFYVQELKKIFSSYDAYTLDNIVISDSDLRHSEYLIPTKVSEIKEKRNKRSRIGTIRVTRSSSAYDYFKAEYRENRISEDVYGNFLVPENDYYGSHKTR